MTLEDSIPNLESQQSAKVSKIVFQFFLIEPEKYQK